MDKLKKSKIASQLGRLGGQKTRDTFGANHFKDLARKRWEKWMCWECLTKEIPGAKHEGVKDFRVRMDKCSRCKKPWIALFPITSFQNNGQTQEA